MGVGEDGNEGAGAIEVEGGGDVVAAFVPEVGEMEEGEMGEGHEGEGKHVEERRGKVSEPCDWGDRRGAYGAARCRWRRRMGGGHLLNGTRAGCGDDLRTGLGRIEGDGAEGGLILGEVLAEETVESLCLLRAEIDGLEVLDVDGVRGGLIHGAEDEAEVPDGGANLDAVGVAGAEVGGFGEGDAGFRAWRGGCVAHGVLGIRLPRAERG